MSASVQVTQTTTETRPGARSLAGSPGTRRPLTGLLFVAPTAVIVLTLFLVPLMILLYMSLTDWPLLGSPKPIGVANYQGVAANHLFVGAIAFTLLYTALTTVLIFGLSFLLVAVSSSSRRGSTFYRTAFFLPYVVGTAAAALLWFANSNDQIGVFARAVSWLGLVHGPAGLLNTPTKALLTTITLVVWKFIGFQVVVLLVGLQGIPGELYDAARVDGASTTQRLRFITLPFLRPTLALLFMLSITGSLLAFDQFIVLTHGGPDNSTITLVLAIYNTAFSAFKLGSAAALSVVVLIALVLLNAIQLYLLRRRDA